MINKALIAIIAIFVSTSIHATPITFTFNGIGDLALDSVEYDSTEFTVILNADTNNIQVFGSIFRYEPVSATIDIGVLGTGTFDSNPVYVFSSQSSTVAGFGIDSHGDLFGTINSVLASYDMQSNLSPTSGSPNDPGQWTNVGTSLGPMSFDNFTSSTFSASLSAVPEPGILPLLAAGGIVMVAVKFMRRKK